MSAPLCRSRLGFRAEPFFLAVLSWYGMSLLLITVKVGEFMRPISAGSTTDHQAGTAVQRCVEIIRQLILVGTLPPGEALRHGALAEQLGTSRIPVREALGALEAEGVVTYVPRVGHTVTRFNSDELTQMYLMRRLLERELLTSVNLNSVDVAYLEDLNEKLAQVSETDGLWKRKHLNRKFHFYLFSLSPLTLVLREVERLWNMSEFYRSLYAYEPDSQQHIVDEHRRIIAAVSVRDHEQLVTEVDIHRQRGEAMVVARLGPPATDLQHSLTKTRAQPHLEAPWVK